MLQMQVFTISDWPPQPKALSNRLMPTLEQRNAWRTRSSMASETKKSERLGWLGDAVSSRPTCARPSSSAQRTLRPTSASGAMTASAACT